MHSIRFVLCALSFLSVTAAVRAENWGRFRGPNGSGIAEGQNIPVEFSAAKNILWKAPVPGLGNSSPMIWNQHLYLLTSSNDAKQRSLLCLDLANGKILWQRSFPGELVKVRSDSSQASASCAVDADGVYAPIWNGATVTMVAFNHQGDPLWSKNLGRWISQHGTGSSPIVVGERVIFALDGDVKDIKGNPIAGASQPALMAFNKKTGDVVWEMPREGYRACYSAPFLVERKNGPELIVASTMSISGYNPDSGKELWSWDWQWEEKKFKFPLRTIAGPLVVGDTLIATSGDGGGDRRMVALNLPSSGKPTYSWGDGNKVFPYVACPLARGEHVYFVNEKGNAGCYEAKTGKQVWYERLTKANVFYASPVMVDGRIYVPTEDGDIFVFAAEPTFKLLAQNRVAESERFMASPAVANGRMYLRGQSHLYCIGNGR